MATCPSMKWSREETQWDWTQTEIRLCLRITCRCTRTMTTTLAADIPCLPTADGKDNQMEHDDKWKHLDCTNLWEDSAEEKDDRAWEGEGPLCLLGHISPLDLFVSSEHLSRTTYKLVKPEFELFIGFI